jgi:hypothetical protein
MPLLWGVAHNRRHTMGVYGNYEREKRNRNHERGMNMNRWNRTTGKTDRIYEENIIISWNRNNEEYKWTRMLIKKKKERKRRKEK